MRSLLLRILKNGLMTAVLLGALGYALGEFATTVLESNAPPRMTSDAPPAQQSNVLATDLKARMPLTLAGWGFALITAIELVRFVVRGGKSEATPKPAPPPVTDETAKLLNELLAKADAERKLAAACPTPATADNTGAS
jgi:hypothetical protein